MKTSIKNPELLIQNLLEFEKTGRYEEGISALKEIWEDTNQLPNLEGLRSKEAAEVVLRCGSLIGLLGHTKQIRDAQEKSKNLLTEARKRFIDLYDVEKIAESETHLAMAYWRTGELVEAESWIEEALSHKIPSTSKTKLFSIIIKGLIFLSLGKHEENLTISMEHERYFLKYGDDFLIGSLYSNLGVSLRNLDRNSEALEKYELAKSYFRKSGHKDYQGAVENNSAYLYKSLGNFPNAHQSVDNSIKIYEEINDRTRKGSSLDTKASIYFDEGKYDAALSTIEESIRILRKGENSAYLVESILTKAKTLVFLDEIASASICLSEGIEIAQRNISEAAAQNLGKEFEIAIRKKSISSNCIDETKIPAKGNDLEIILHSSLSHYENHLAIRINNNHLSDLGLSKDFLAIAVKEKINNGDLVAITDLTNDSVICGFYDSYFGTVSISGIKSDPILFNEENVRILGKIVGAGNPGKLKDGKIFIEPVKLLT